MASLTDIYDEAQTALLAILQRKAASYTVGATTYSMHNIKELQDLIERLGPLIARETGVRPTILLADSSGRA